MILSLSEFKELTIKHAKQRLIAFTLCNAIRRFLLDSVLKSSITFRTLLCRVSESRTIYV